MPSWVDAYCAQHRGRLTTISMLAFFCVVLPREVWRRVGPLDERFGAGMFEDDDYYRRVREAGFEVRLALDSFVHHWQRASFKLLGEDEYLRIYRENQARYADKWGQGPLAPLQRAAALAPATVVFAPSVGWAIPLAQRPHHIARVLAREGYAVVFDSTNAHDDVDTLREIEPRLFLYKGPPGALAGLPRTILWTFSYNYDYRDAFPPKARVVYDWIDDLGVFPYERAKLAAWHERALREADLVLTVARRLQEDALRSRPDARYVPNAVESGRFHREPEPNPALADPEFAAILAAGKPIAGYYGALANWFDYALLAAVARRRPDWSFVLIGPDHDGSLAKSGVTALANVHALGPRPYPALPGYLHRFAVATIPFAINDITLATSPLKLYEYFAAGKPVISTPMPECMAYDVVRVVRDADGFSSALDEALQAGRDPAVATRLKALAEENTWRARAVEVMEALAAQPRGLERDDRPADAVPPVATPQPSVPASAPTPVPAPRAPRPRARRARLGAGRDHAALRAPRHAREPPLLPALAGHLGHAVQHPCLTMYMEFALSTNQRGRKVADLIDRLMPLAGKRTLDVGCAYGGFLVAMAERGAQPSGFDIEPTLLALGAQNFADVGQAFPTRLADVTRGEDVAPFREAFDVVTCNDVIEHVRDPAVAVGHIASMLAPGGLAYFEIPNRDAAAFVLSDGHYQLFGITQLDYDAARRYFAAHSPGVPYGVEHYLRVPEYRAIFAAASLAFEVLPDEVPPDYATVLAQLDELRRSLDDKLAGVPAALRDEVRLAVLRYLDEATAAPRDGEADRAAFLQRFGTGFWRVVGRKPAAIPAPAPTREPAIPASLAHEPFLRGTCNICGRRARFFRDDPSLDRESLTCEHCARRRATGRSPGVLRAIAQRAGVEAPSIAALPAKLDGVHLSIFHTQRRSASSPPPTRCRTCCASARGST